MKCQRCGYCCIALPVVIIQEEVDGELCLYYKPTGKRCPNLVAMGVEVVCKIHDKPWYSSTPCFRYQNSDVDPDYFNQKGKPCAVGPYTMSKRIFFPCVPGDEIKKLGSAKFHNGQIEEL